MEPAVENSAVIGRVAEAHELVERLKTEIYAGEEKRMTRRVVHKLLFYFLVTLMVGSIIGMFYMNWQTENRLSMAKKTGILTLGDGSMFELTPISPKNQPALAAATNIK
jgi:hypothetical protein